jgi:peroxiredoxin
MNPKIVLILWLLLVGAFLGAQEKPSALAIGASAPDFSLPGVDGKTYKLSDFNDSKVLAIVFLCNHCTESQLYESRIQKLTNDFKGQGVAVVAIQPDNPESVPVEDLAYSDVGDSLAEMKVRAAFRHFTFPYLYDGDTQKVARVYGPQALPYIFIFDKDRKLRYEGRVDDSVLESRVQHSYARDAISALLAGNTVATPHTEASGCPPRWIAKPAEIRAMQQKAEAEPVNLALVDAGGLTKLRTNPGGKLMVVNFFATWCGPCVSEFPDLMATNRMFRRRNFAMTTVSSNEPEEEPDVLKFLRKMHASSTNLLFGTTDTYGLQAAFDPAMGAGVPFTVVMAPNGDILFQQTGDLDMMELRRAILSNLPDDPGHEGAQQYWETK